MPTPIPTPRSIPAWIKALDGVRLPVTAEESSRARRALGDERRSLREMAESIQGSPVLALEILREANRNRQSLGATAESLEVALTRIGLQRASELLGRLPTLDPAQPLPAFFQLLVVSQHASQQARGLFGQRLARLWQEIHWSSLLFLAPAWALACAYPQLLHAWEQRVLGRGEPSMRVERDLLGVSLLELCAEVARHWRLPDWIAQGYRLLSEDRRLLVKALHIARDHADPLHQQQRLDDDPELRRWLTLPSNTPVLANGLAIAAHHSWSAPHTLRWQRLAALYLQHPLETLQQLMHREAVISARVHTPAGLWHPALALIWPWQSSYPAAQAPAATAVSGNVSRWRECCAELLRDPSPFANPQQLATAAREALTAGGMQRILLLHLDRGRQLLVAGQTQGLPTEAEELQIDLAHSPLLRQMVDQPRQLHLNADNIARFTALLPGALKALFVSEHLMLRSVASNGRVLMLVVADQRGAALNAMAVQAFGKTVQCIDRALELFARRPR
ncbi:HDOD domain-containing protein [Stutzerimonas tarimensis]|uniref:HDOD domain-containing protein n=1 Tax=Stutzerimonas tarimensis TaxID=1507735 RepID=A0ABV7T4H5_9GAMM